MSVSALPPGELVVKGFTFPRALFCAPMAGFTHSAFRRLMADFGGYGALFTEMLSGRWLLNERVGETPSTRRRPEEGLVIYQLMLGEPEEVEPVLRKLERIEPAGLDLNLACPAPVSHARRTGSRLFADRERMLRILEALRAGFKGLLTVKTRLGDPEEGWEERLWDRLRLIEGSGVDALTMHPRFSSEHLRGRARHELYPAIVMATSLPVLACGDILGPETLDMHAASFKGVAGIMVGRMAVIRPWLFSNWGREPEPRDLQEIWERHTRYVLEDFPEGKAFFRVKAFTRYFSRNFFFGHNLHSIALSSTSLDELRARTGEFFSRGPRVEDRPGTSGLR